MDSLEVAIDEQTSQIPVPAAQKLDYIYEFLRRFELTQSGFVPKLAVRTRLLAHAVSVPKYAHDTDAGADLYAAIAEPMDLAPGQQITIPTGICIELPPGYEAQVRGRSGLAMRHGLSITQGVGTIDAAYRGEIMVLLTNLGSAMYVINPGDKIAQLVVSNVYKADYQVVDTLGGSSRNDNGFGSTGL